MGRSAVGSWRRVSRLQVLAGVALLAVPSLVAAQVTSATLKRFDGYVAKAVKDWSVPGLAIAIVRNDSIVFSKGYGVRTLGKPEPVDEHTLFAIGSTTKAMTAALMGMLVDDGRVQWDAPVISYLPDFVLYDPYATREFTVRDLLTHRGGLPNTDFLWADSGNAFPVVLHRMRFAKPAYSFRSSFIYQNVMYATAGALEAQVTKGSWDELLRSRILQPLGMSETVTSVKVLPSLPDVATPHAMIDDSVRIVHWRNLDNIGPAGSVNSNVHDMARWIRFLLDSARTGGRRVLAPATFAELFTPQQIVPPSQFYPTAKETNPHVVSYGLGCFLHEYRGRRVAMHTGSIDGMSAIVGMLPDERVGVVVLANLDHAELRHALMMKVFDMYTGSPDRDWSRDLLALYGKLRTQAQTAQKARQRERDPDAQPPLPLARYAGTYTDSLLGVVRIVMENKKLVAHSGSSDVGDLEPWNGNTFVVTWRDPLAGKDLVTFVPTTSGAIGEVRVDGLGSLSRSGDSTTAAAER